MKKLNKILIATSLFFVFTGCEEQVLDKLPRDVFSEVDVWSDIELAQKFQNTIYAGLGYWAVGNYIDTYAMYSDEAMVGEDLNVYYFNRGQLASDNMGRFEPIWGLKYSYIRKANIFLNKIDELSGNVERIQVMKGEVKYLRARMYFDLIKLWGGVPLITEPMDLDDDFMVSRNSYEEIVDWISKELDEATEMVPAERAPEDFGRVTKGACLGTKSNVLLHANSKLHDPGTAPEGPFFDYTKDTWQDCADAAKAVIDMPQYELQPVENWEDYHRIFIEPNSEMVFAKLYHNNYGSGGRHFVGPNAPIKDGGWAELDPLQGLIDEFEMANGKKIHEQESGYDPSPEKIYENRELRFYANILYQGSEWKTPLEFVHPGGTEVSTPPWTIPGYLMRKFMDERIELWQDLGNTPWIWIRLATMYLNYAEAQYELGNEAEAREYVNIIRNRVGLPDIDSSGEELFKDIQHERRIELVFENQRFFDVRRWMIAEETENEDAIGIVWKKLDANGNLDPNGVLTYTFETFQERSFLERMYYLPIPIAEMQKSDLEQNPGY
jgi:hypothetical protein